MRPRLLGQETEYAIRYEARDGRPRPSHEVIHKALVKVLERTQQVQHGERWSSHHQVFVENGGAFYYEFFPQAPADGLIEGSTPECRGPGQLLLYQRVQERLLKDALPLVRAELENAGHAGRVALLKNGRDAEGHVYGAQESYEAEVATGWRLWAGRAVLSLLLPAVLVTAVVGWVLLVVLVVGYIAFLLGAGLAALMVPPLRARVAELFELDERGSGSVRALGLVTAWFSTLLVSPVAVPFAGLFRALWFVPVRRALSAHVASRVVFTGVGTLHEGGRFGLSEKAPELVRETRLWGGPAERVIYDTGHMVKALTSPISLRFGPYFGLYRRRQRLQVGLSDANRAQVAEYLKVGTTALVMDMAEAGLLADVPRLRDPAAAARALADDPSLKAQVALMGGGTATALELQRALLERARAYVETSDVTSLEDREVVRLWGQVLDALEQDPGGLVGRVDWVTKRYLIEASADGEAFVVQKKVDLRYHELGSGYFDMLEDRGGAPWLVDEAAVLAALRTPPADSPAMARSRIIKDVRHTGEKIYVSWDSVRVGGRIGGKVIRLQDYRG
ncbi:MAG: proteasome accessory factor PafA2 family protein [Myxococcales bacterium]|nr:proteasome accessory factor PafA2 family protein [Myxococcales bacterium]